MNKSINSNNERIITDLIIYSSVSGYFIYIIYGILLFFKKEGLIFSVVGILATINFILSIGLLIKNNNYNSENFNKNKKQILLNLIGSTFAIFLCFSRGGII